MFNQIGVVNIIPLLAFFIKMVFFFSIHVLTLINGMVGLSENTVILLKIVLLFLLRLVCHLNFGGMTSIQRFFLLIDYHPLFLVVFLLLRNFSQKKSKYLFLQPFRCDCFPHLRPYFSHKLNFGSKMCLFIGYSLAYKIYLCLNPARRIFISRNVIFHPLDFPNNSKYVSSSSTSSSSSIPSITTTFTITSTQTFPHLFNSYSSSLVVQTPPPTTQVPRSHVPAPVSHSSPSSNIHPMTTRSKANIFKPKAYIATKHPLPITPLPCEPKSVK